MFVRDLYIVTGIAWLAVALLFYLLTGSFSLKNELAGAGRTAGPVICVLISLDCLLFAWLDHAKQIRALATT